MKSQRVHTTLSRVFYLALVFALFAFSGLCLSSARADNEMPPAQEEVASGEEESAPSDEETALATDQPAPTEEQTSPPAAPESPTSEQATPTSEPTAPTLEEPALTPQQVLKNEAWGKLHYAVETLLVERRTAQARQEVQPLLSQDLPSFVIAYVHYVLAAAAAFDGDLDTARSEYRQMASVSEYEPAIVAGAEGAACCLVSKGDYAAAISEFEAIIRNHPGFPEYCAEARYQIGECLYRQERFAEALEHFRRVLSEYPGTSWVTAAQEKITQMEADFTNGGAQ